MVEKKAGEKKRKKENRKQKQKQKKKEEKERETGEAMSTRLAEKAHFIDIVADQGSG